MSFPKPAAATLLALTVFLFASTDIAGSDKDRAARQAQLDAACEAAREQKLAPIRRQFVEQCVADGQFDSREECETYYADYGAQSGHRAPLFYDLPPCVEAFEYAQSERAGG